MQKVKMRLYRQHDMDLMALHRADGYEFGREMKRVLVAYANGQNYEPRMLDAAEFGASYVPKCVSFNILLNETKEEDAKAIAMLSEIKVGYRNSFLKSLFRSHMMCLPLTAFSKENGLVTKKDTLGEFHRIKMDAMKKEAMKGPAENRGVSPQASVLEPIVTMPAENPIIDEKEEKCCNEDSGQFVVSVMPPPLEEEPLVQEAVTADEFAEEESVPEESMVTESAGDSEGYNDDELNSLFNQMCALNH